LFVCRQNLLGRSADLRLTTFSALKDDCIDHYLYCDGRIASGLAILSDIEEPGARVVREILGAARSDLSAWFDKMDAASFQNRRAKKRASKRGRTDAA
jgi:hypothetical protein